MLLLLLLLMLRSRLEKADPCDECKSKCSEEVPQDIGLNIAALHAADCERNFLSDFCESIHRSIDDVAIKPCDGLTDKTEDNLMGDEEIDLIPVEAVVSRSPKTGHRIAELRGE